MKYDHFNEINEYLLKRFYILGCQHRIFHRITSFFYKLLNFESAPKILHNDLKDNYLELSFFDICPNFKVLINKTIKLDINEDNITKFRINTYRKSWIITPWCYT